MATHKDRTWVTAFDSPSPMHIFFNNPIQICFMSAGKPAPRFSFALGNSHKNPLDFNYGVFHMSSMLRPYVLVSAYSVLSKKTLLHILTLGLWFRAAQQQLPPFARSPTRCCFASIACGLWCCYCQIAGTGWCASSSAQQLLTHMWSINPGSRKAKCPCGRAFY